LGIASPASNGTVVAAAVAATALCVLAGIVTATSSATVDVPLEVIGRVLIGGVPVAVGLFAWSRPTSARFGRSLTILGFGACVGTLAASDDATLYSIGRVAAWLVEAGLVYVVLSFPTGTITHRADRLLVAMAVVASCVLFLPTALVVDEFPVPSPWTGCASDCPANALQLTTSEPGFVDAVVRPLRETITIALFLAVTVRLWQRYDGAGRLARRTLAPVLLVACARSAVYAAAFVVRAIAPGSAVTIAATWTIGLMLPAIGLAFLAGLLRWRLFVGSALEQLGRSTARGASADDLRRALADAFDDPDLQILYWLPGPDARWLDASGRTVAPPSPGSGRTLTQIEFRGRRAAALVHDDALRDERAFVDAAVHYTLVALENQRLEAKTSALLHEVEASRARIAASADEERRRIERDLHDGAQQRLVALRVRLKLAAEMLERDHASGVDMVEQLGSDAEAALDEVRALARGVFPALLADRGLADALQSAGLRSPLPVVVVAEGGRRYPRAVESAAYFCCLEAMQNAAKHATGATRITVTLAQHDGALTLEVVDDGAGFDPWAVRNGAGLDNMRDRARACGGDLTLDAAAGRGTRVRATIPLDGT
jgi:signal transduction histidine kinase